MDPEHYDYTRINRSGYLSDPERVEREAAAAARDAYQVALDTATAVRRELLKSCYGNPKPARVSAAEIGADPATTSG
jgi:hypothetical protein